MAHWLKPDEAARHLGISLDELLGLVASDSGPRYYRKGPLRRFAMEDLDTWVEQELADQTPENSEGWETCEAGSIGEAAKPVKSAPPEREAPGDLRDLYAENGEALPTPEQARANLFGADGQPIGKTEYRISTRGACTVVDEGGQTIDVPDASEGIDPSLLAGVDAVPPGVVKACEETEAEQRRIILERLSQPRLR